MARRPTEPTANPARGAALVVVAVLIGLFLLRNGLDTSTSVDSSSDGTSITDGETDGTDESADEGTDEGTGTTVPLKTPAEVPTIILNGSGVTGAAGRYSQALAALGYNLTDANGADATSDVTATQILYGPGFDREAAVVGTAIGAPATVVPQPLGTTQPGVISGAQVVVVLGPDIANATPPSSAAGQ